MFDLEEPPISKKLVVLYIVGLLVKLTKSTLFQKMWFWFLLKSQNLIFENSGLDQFHQDNYIHRRPNALGAVPLFN